MFKNIGYYNIRLISIFRRPTLFPRVSAKKDIAFYSLSICLNCCEENKMNTELYKIDPASISFDSNSIENPQPVFTSGIPYGLSKAARVLREGKSVVGMPTETVYGLGGNALQEESCKAIFRAKGRPSDNPLIVHVSSLNMLRDLVGSLPSIYEEAVSHFWPGPLTILLPVSSHIPKVVTGGHSSVAVRFPSHPVARALISLAGVPVAAPSANTSGRPSPTLASHVIDDLNGKIPIVLDAGACVVGLESTVLDGLRDPPVILRPGGITLEQLRSLASLSKLRTYHRKDFSASEASQIEECPTTPGMKYRHYSPSACVLLLDPISEESFSREKYEATLLNTIKKIDSDKKICIISHFPLSSSTIAMLPPSVHISLSKESSDPTLVARSLFAQLRMLDDPTNSFDVALIEGIIDQGLGVAVMNRLRKAASEVISY